MEIKGKRENKGRKLKELEKKKDNEKEKLNRKEKEVIVKERRKLRVKEVKEKTRK